MNISQMRCLLEVSECLSITEAARKLYFTRQAVSKSIQNLEMELGVSLIERQADEISLTLAGRLYASHFSRHLQKLKHLVHENKLHGERLLGRFSVGLAETLDCSGKLYEAIASYKRQEPKKLISVRQCGSRKLIEAIWNGALDVAILKQNDLPNDSNLEFRKMAKLDMRLYGPAELLLAECNAVAAANCWRQPFLTTLKRNCSFIESKLMIIKEISALGLNPPSIRIMPNVQTVYAELEMSNGVIVGDENFGRQSTIVGLASWPLDIDSYLYCMWSKINENPCVQPFVEAVEKTLENPAWKT